MPSTQEPQGIRKEKTPSTLFHPASLAGQKRKMLDGRDEPAEKRQEDTPEDRSEFAKSLQGDIVERGLVTMDKAAELFERFNKHMTSHLPAVIFPPDMTAAGLREHKPTLFLAIMAAATSESPSLQKVLQKELMYVFAEKVFITGQKTVEVIQAIHVAVIWYWPPEHFEELKFYQLVHVAAVMAIDIGLGQRTAQRRRTVPDQLRISPYRRVTPPEPTTIENRRTWLTCYFLAANTSMALHRPNLVRWSPFMSECVEVLENSPDAAATDKYFCHLVWTHRLAEEVGMQFALDDPTAVITLTDPRTQYALRGLERDLEKYSASISPELMQRESPKTFARVLRRVFTAN